MARAFKRLTDRADTAVHHVGRGDNVRARRSLIEALADQHVDRGIVEHVTRIVDQPVLTVAGIGIERHVGQHAHIRPAGIADRPDRAAHQVVRIERLGPVFAAATCLRVGEQGQAGNAERHGFFCPRGDAIH